MCHLHGWRRRPLSEPQQADLALLKLSSRNKHVDEQSLSHWRCLSPSFASRTWSTVAENGDASWRWRRESVRWPRQGSTVRCVDTLLNTSPSFWVSTPLPSEDYGLETHSRLASMVFRAIACMHAAQELPYPALAQACYIALPGNVQRRRQHWAAS